MTPKWRLRMAWIVVVASITGCPLSTFTRASAEPQFVLGSSWLAITLTALDIRPQSSAHGANGSASGRYRPTAGS